MASSIPRIAVTTTPLYGILVSRKSYLVGLRCLVKTHHAQMLAGKIGAGRLPQELVDLIADRLAELEHEVVRRTSDGGAWSEKERKSRYCREDPREWTPAESEAFAQVAKLNIEAVQVNVSRVESGREVHYMHLSARSPRPAVAMNLPCNIREPCHDEWRQTVHYRAPESRQLVMDARCRPDSPIKSDGLSLDAGYLSQESAVYMAKAKKVHRAEARVSRLLELANVQAAIAAWDQEELARYVELLQLVSVESDRVLKPVLRLLQVVEEQ